MKEAIPFVLVLALIITSLYSLFGSDGYPRLRKANEQLESQKGYNSEMRAYVHSLEDEIAALEKDERKIEQAARDQYGMARPDELLFVFDGKPAETASQEQRQ